jgi:serine/threonine protein kinase, bacterial
VFGSGGDDGPALEAPFKNPEDVAMMPDGGFLIADTGNRVVRRVSPDGIVTRVAGTGAAGNTSDDGLAVDAALDSPSGLAVFPDGSFLIADQVACVVRLVSRDGVITRVAGTGSRGSADDDGPATEAQLNEPLALALTPDGGFLILQTLDNVIRKVSAAGTISRVAGTGTIGTTGDDGPATEAEFVELSDLATTADGGFLISDSGAHVVRRVWP